MRERLNNDPKVQLAVFAIAAVALGLLLMIQLGGGVETATTDPNAAATTAATDPAASGTDATGSGSTATETGVTDTGAAGTATAAPDTSATAPATTPSTATPPAAETTDALLPTKGLPGDVLVAYAKSRPVVLLVVDPGARGTPRLEKYADRLQGYRGAEVFVVPTKKIAKYSRITEGVSVSQTPAIVAVTPRKVASGAPTASVTYGIRSKKSFRQAIADAAYKGGPRPAYP